MHLQADSLWAEGSGRDLALGAAYGLASSDVDVPESEIVQRAVEAAIVHDANCGGSAWCTELRSATPGPNHAG